MTIECRGWVRVVLRVLLAAVFAVSSVSKLVSIDHFELYVYSFGLLPLNAVFVLTRLCIGAELALAVMIAAGWYPRLTRLAALGLTLFFSLFLCYTVLIDRTDSCQCFGQLVDMNPTASLLKNAVLIVLLLLYFAMQKPHAPRHPKARLWGAVAVCTAAMVVPFVVSVPDNWAFGHSESRYNEDLFLHSIGPEGQLADYHLTEGNHLVAFVTPGCPYCRMARRKLGSIADRHHIAESSMLFFEPGDLPDLLFLDITYGQRPLILLLEGGEVRQTYHYRNISERQIARALGRSE